jgi:glycosyltransferase involved in cell wall biosynthesis
LILKLILVNDGSTDKTLEILENLAQTDERIKSSIKKIKDFLVQEIQG